MTKWLLFPILSFSIAANTVIKKLDKEYIAEVESPEGEKSDKVLHAEPLFIDLIRDLGARAGEMEVNLGMGVNDKRNFARVDYLAEIEWAPFNRLGVEFELPFTDNTRYDELTTSQPGPSGLSSIKVATQYTFFVSEKYATSAALGYLLTERSRNAQNLCQVDTPSECSEPCEECVETKPPFNNF